MSKANSCGFGPMSTRLHFLLERHSANMKTDIPARLLAGQVAKLLNCSTDDVAILVSAGKLRALGKPTTARRCITPTRNTP